MKKVHILPNYLNAPPEADNGGIRRVAEAQIKHLPEFGWQPVPNDADADVIATHGTQLARRADVPAVHHSHGLYWDRYDWGDWAYDMNRQVRESMRRAAAHTACSEWVGAAMRRGMMVYPTVIYHGVDPEEFKPGSEPQDYILWNKARTDLVSNQEDLDNIASLMPNRHFVSTFGKEASNTHILGKVSYADMKLHVAHAGLYLATARETFGIGTLEALAAGVPVVGWDWGGQSEIVIPNETGYLAFPGDYKALAGAIERALINRPRLSLNARLDVMERWLWPDKIEKYAEIYDETLEWWGWGTLVPKVSVIVTCHDLGRFLPDCLNSVKRQTMDDWECIVVDDVSEDDTQRIGESFAADDKRFKYYKARYNLKLSGARNMGVKRSHGHYIIMLDADDMLAPRALETLSQALDKDPGLHIAYGHLDTVSEDGSNQKRSEGWPWKEFSWSAQLAHFNQMPYSAMMRREVFENAGGYRLRQWRAEDAELWCRLTSFGAVAKKVTEASTLIYRWRENSKTRQEQQAGFSDGPWTEMFAWNTATEVNPKQYKIAVEGVRIPYDIVPFGAQGDPKGHKFWRVPDYAYPQISVVIPVGPNHKKLVIDALDSLVGQNFTNWEAIVVNDTGEEWKPGFGSPVWGAPFARVTQTDPEHRGTSAARNRGASFARGECLLFLDADDYLMPNALWTMWEGYKQTSGGIIYTDWYKDDGPGTEREVHETDDFKCEDVLSRLHHSVTALIPQDYFEQVGGFDESFKIGFEDWDLYIALQVAGACSYRIAEPLFVYRFLAGKRREESFKQRKEILQQVRDKWIDFYEGRLKMPCGKCPGGQLKIAPPPAYAETITTVSVSDSLGSATVVLEYQGEKPGPITIKGKTTHTAYRFGLNENDKRKFVYAADAAEFLSRNVGGKPMFVKVR